MATLMRLDSWRQANHRIYPGTAKGTLHYKYYFRMREVEEYTGGPAPVGARRARRRGRVSWPAPALQRGAEGAKALGGLNF